MPELLVGDAEGRRGGEGIIMEREREGGEGIISTHELIMEGRGGRCPQRGTGPSKARR